MRRLFCIFFRFPHTIIAMKRKLLVASILCLLLALLPACAITGERQSIKAITAPYVAEYECTEAHLGNEDFLSKYDYIKITLLDKKELEVSFKPVNGNKKSFKGEYTIDPQTRIFSGQIGILGCTFKESTKIEHGEFIITKNILSMPLVMKFEMK